MGKIPTAKEVFELETSENTSDKLLDWEKQHILDAMIEFAKIHVTTALKRADNHAKMYNETITIQDGILKSYSFDNIK